MTNLNKNYYEILEVSSNATQEQIYNAYVQTKNAYTVDSVALYSLMSKDECNKLLDQIEEAYTILSDTEKRKLYNEARGINQVHTNYVDTSSQNLAPPEDEDISRKTAVNKIPDGALSKMVASKRFSLAYNVNSDFEKEIEQTTVYTGTFLKKVREYKQVDIPRMAEMTKISKTYLQNIENEDLKTLPALVYVRGFVYQYAKCLKLNPDLVASSYLFHLKKTYDFA